MSFDDFYSHFSTLGICDRSVNVDSEMHMRINYENTCYGPFFACMDGMWR